MVSQSTASGTAPPRLALRGITKQYPGCLANDSVDLALLPGEIHALLGENGAGKSTLVKIVYGVLKADSGETVWEGEPVQIGSPAQARALGIGLVFQHFSLFDSLTVAENVALGIDHTETLPELSRRIVEVSQRYGLALDPARHVHTLSVGERQRVEIVRCLLQDPRLLIMDEPTSVLTPQEAETLFETLRRLASEGCTILYISHKLEEIRVLCHRATVMRGGRVVSECDPREESARGLAEMMIGSELSDPQRIQGGTVGEPMLVVDHLSTTADNPFGTDIRHASFSVRAGEIFGIAGVAGNGQAELMSALSGEILSPVDHAIRIGGTEAGHLGPAKRRALGLAFVPEERMGHGAVPELSLADNALLSGYDTQGLVRGGMIRFEAVRETAVRVIDTFRVVASGYEAEAQSLSGGNLQKFIIGREILQKPKLLVAAAPTWGVDAGAAAAIHQALIDLAQEGVAVLIVSQDLDELFAICDRIAVLFHGRLSDALETHSTTVDQIGLRMGGMIDTAEEASDAK